MNCIDTGVSVPVSGCAIHYHTHTSTFAADVSFLQETHIRPCEQKVYIAAGQTKYFNPRSLVKPKALQLSFVKAYLFNMYQHYVIRTVDTSLKQDIFILFM